MKVWFGLGLGNDYFLSKFNISPKTKT